jgi:hypothetical protein
MNVHVRILLALLGCLVFGGNALAVDPSHCDALCCDEPCESAPLAPEACACCAVHSTAEADTALPAVAPAAPLPALAAASASLPDPTILNRTEESLTLAAAPSSPFQRTVILRN